MNPIFTGADTIRDDIGLLPDGLNMYASYVDNFGGYPELVARFKDAAWHPYLLSITIFGNAAKCADMEKGAMSISDFPNWYDTRAIKSPGDPPWGYTSVSNMDSLAAIAGNREFIPFSAHYGDGEHICGPDTCGLTRVHCKWTQWDDKGAQGQNIDRSLGIWLPSTHPQPPKPEDYMAIAAAQAADGQLHVFVEDKNGAVWYTYQHRNDPGWNGGKQGQQVAGLVPFAPAPR